MVSLHIAGYARISIAPPCAAETSLSLEDPELVETLFPQASRESDSRLAGADDEDRIVGICGFMKAVDDPNAVGWR